MSEYRFTDSCGAALAIRPAPWPGAAAVDCDPDGAGLAVFVPAHRLAEVVTALYEAAGQEAPDLPDIRDQAQVTVLARCLRVAFGHVIVTDGAAMRAARSLLDQGVTFTGTGPAS
jgi:hypothetical protein